MIFWAEQKPNALFGSYVFDIHTRRPFSASRREDWRTGKSNNLLTIIPEEERRGIYRVTDFFGMGLWIPSEVFKTIGLFDAKHLRHYGADNDFTLRAGKYGFEVYCNFDAVLYSYVEASGQYECKRTYSIANYYRCLFGIKSSKNLKNFTIIAFRHCPRKYLLWYWLYGVARRIGGYIVDWGHYTLRNFRMK
jgi:GT2 family glycosyltransferase